MSKLLKRAIRRQESIRRSRDIAWILLVAVLAVAWFGFVSIIRSVELAGSAFTVGGITAGIVVVVAFWVALQLGREALRLGRLLKDPELIMRLDREDDLNLGVNWSGLLPFSSPRE